MKTARLACLAAGIMLVGCATDPASLCRSAAAEQDIRLAQPDGALTEYVIDAGSRTLVWPADESRASVRCAVRQGRVRSLYVGDAPLYRESAR